MLRFLFCLFCALISCVAHADETPPAPAVPATVPVVEDRSTRVVAPGIELTTIRRNSPDAPLQIFITKVDPKGGGEKPKWKLKLATGGATVFDFAPTSQIAAREKAIVGINGGYFAFGGAALGALKIDGEWIRLPLKNRTAVGFDENGGVLIDNLRVDLDVHFGRTAIGDDYSSHTITVSSDVLNGYAPENGVSLLTPRFGQSYKLRFGEIAIPVGGMAPFHIGGSKIEKGEVKVSPKQWTLVAHGTANDLLKDYDQTPFRYSWLEFKEPAAWQKYPTVLGAGPRLLNGGKIFTTEKEEEFRPDVLARGPRSAFGVDAKGNWIFLVCDGREKEYSAGLSIPELAAEMQNAGAVDALCLDGGGSSTLVVDNQVINRPSDGQERKIPDAILVVPAN